MTEKQMLFCEEYLKDMNGSRAYKAAYPNVKKDTSARVCASQLLTKTNVKEYIAKRLEQIHNDNTADVAEVMEYLTSVLRGTSESSVLAMIGDGVQGIVFKTPDEKDKLKAAELLGKRFGLFKDNIGIELTVPQFSGDEDLED